MKLKYNTRARYMFAAMLGFMNEELGGINGASVLDLGCGYGDILWYFANNGAKSVTGVDIDIQNIAITSQKMLTPYSVPEYVAWHTEHMDITNKGDLYKLGNFDIAICTSVLPYLDQADRNAVLKFMSTNARISFVEMQYFGDGPGPKGIDNDADMKEYLDRFWYEVSYIGSTYTGRRLQPYRSIWRCFHAR